MIPFQIGKKSDGSVVTWDICILPNLFVSYQTLEEFENFTTTILAVQAKEINECLIISKRHFTNQIAINQETFVYSEPEAGSIKSINLAFTNPYKTLRKAINKNAPLTRTVIVIDDIWQIVPKLKKGAASQFKQLLNKGVKKGIHFIIGSSMPYRNLLLQLMIDRSEENKTGVINQLGAELIFNIDGLIFYRERNDINFITYYP